MVRTVPSIGTHIPSDLVTATDYNNGPAASNTFLTTIPIFMGYQTAAQLITNNTLTAITLNAELVDSDGGHSPTTNTSRYTCQVAGWYAAAGVVSFASNGTGSRMAAILRNGLYWTGASAQGPPANAGVTSLATNACLVQLNVNDYIELFTFQNSGGSLNTSVTTRNTSGMSVWWIAHV